MIIFHFFLDFFDSFSYTCGMEKVVIELVDWDHTCGDGCCYSWGTELYINGEEIHHNISELGTDGLIKLICEKLNVEVEVISS